MVVGGISFNSSVPRCQKQVKNDNPGYSKLWLGLAGGSCSCVIGGLGLSLLKSKVSLQSVRMQAEYRQFIDAPVKINPIRCKVNDNALKVMKESLPSQVYKNMSAGIKNDIREIDEFALEYNKRVNLHNLKCEQWQKATTRKYLKYALNGAKKRVLKERCFGAALLTIAAAGIAQTIYYCTK